MLLHTELKKTGSHLLDSLEEIIRHLLKDGHQSVWMVAAL